MVVDHAVLLPCGTPSFRFQGGGLEIQATQEGGVF